MAITRIRGDQIQDDSIDGNKISNESIQSVDIKNGTVLAEDVATDELYKITSWKKPVNDFSSLPVTASSGDAIVDKATGHVYVWTTSWQLVGASAAGNAETATKLQTIRNINGIGFDGTSNITIYDSTKEPSFSSGSLSQYFRGDKSWQALDKSVVGLGNVINESKTTMFENSSFTGTTNLSSVNINTSSSFTNGVLNILNSNLPGALSVGIVGGSSNGVTTSQGFKIGSAHYNRTEEPVAMIMSNNQLGSNTVVIGGGSSALNAATNIKFFTAADTITTSGTEVMSILSDGKIGINNSGPISLLDIKGTKPILTFTESTVLNSWIDGELIGGIDWYTSDSSGIGAHYTANIKILNESVQTTPSSAMTFWTGGASQASTEKMRITSGGSIGLGTTTPLSVLTTTAYTVSNVNAIHVGGKTYGRIIASGSAGGAIDLVDYGATVDKRWYQVGSSDNELFFTAVTDDGAGSQTRMKITDTGALSIGSITTNRGDTNSLLNVSKTGWSVAHVQSYSTTIGEAPVLILSKSHSATIGTLTPTITGSILGGVDFKGIKNHTTPAWAHGAAISVYQNGIGTSGTNYVPADIVFSTSTPAGLYERMRVSTTGNIGINSSGDSMGVSATNYRVLEIAGSGAANAEACGVIELINNRATVTLGDTTGYLVFASLNNGATTQTKQIAAITSSVTGSTVGNRGGDLIFKTKPDNVALTNESLRITSDGRIYGSYLHNNSGPVTGATNQYIASGTYTPSISTTTNVAASVLYTCQWMRVGNVVTLSGQVDIDVTTASVSTTFNLSLPIASNFISTSNCSGTAVSSTLGHSMAIYANITTDTLYFQNSGGWTTASNIAFLFTVTYVIL